MTTSFFHTGRSRRETCRISSIAVALLFAAVAPSSALAGSAPTTTTLSITSGGSAVTTVTPGSVVTLTATVNLYPGVVRFCVATATYCTGSNLLATAQLTAVGSAIYKFTPGVGVHHYKAVFVGTQANATSTSAISTLTVTGGETVISATGTPGNYTLTGIVIGGSQPPTGKIGFLDTTNGDSSLGTASLAPGPSALSFAATSTPTVGPGAIATADFNGDGIPDFVVASDNDQSVTAFLGKGDGTFTAVRTPGLQTGVALVVGDFNVDGIPDLAFTNGSNNNVASDSVTVLLGKGDGTFTTASTPTVGSGPYSITEADFNGDGIPDLATANLEDTTVTVLLGKGDGTFTTASTISIGSSGYELDGIASGDFNGDGIQDLVTVNTGYDTLTVLLGNGDGTFQTGVTYNTGENPLSVAVGDFNGDGILDLATANEYDGSVSILLGKGDGSFEGAVAYGVGYYPVSVVTGDFNADGDSDLAVVNGGDNTVSVLLGKGDGTFASALSLPVGNSPKPLVAIDFTGDGLPDLAVVNEGDLTVSVLMNQFCAATSATAILTGVGVTGGGTHLIEASYGGDATFGPSLSRNEVSLLDPQISTTLTLGSSQSMATTEQSVTVTATLTPFSSGNVTTNGEKVVFANNGSYIGSSQIANGIASFTNALPAGTNVISASYGGDATFSAATSTSMTIVVSLAAPTLTWAPPAAITYGTALGAMQLDATATMAGTAIAGNFTYSPSAGTVLPAGTQTLSVAFAPTDTTDFSAVTATVPITVNPATPILGFTPIANVTAGAPPFIVQATSASTGAVTYTVTSGPATVTGSTVTVTGVGTVVLFASQAAAGNYTTATATTSFEVTAAAVLDFTISAGQPQSQTIQAGSSATFALQVAPTAGAFPGNVTFTATGTPAGATTSFTPATVASNAGATVVTLTVTTAATTALRTGSSSGAIGESNLPPLALSALFLPFAGIASMRKRGDTAARLLTLCLIALGGLMTFMTLIACGGASSPSTATSPRPQTYEITVTANSGSVQHSTTITLQED